MAAVALAPSIPAVTLSPQHLELQAKLRDFAEREIKPVVAERDAFEDPDECFSWEIWRKASRLGYRILPMPPEYGGVGMDILGHCIALEELCAADVAVGVTFHQVWKLCKQLLKTAYLKQEVLPKFLADDDYMFCLAFTEPDVGSDNLLPYEGADGGSRTRAAQQPNGDWIINGKKHFPSFAGLAKGSFVLCRTDFTKGMPEGATVFFVDNTAPGFRFGHTFNKLGWRLHPNGEMILDDVRVPDGARLGEVNKGLAAVGSFGKPHAATGGAFWLGTARAAYELTIERCHAPSRRGSPITDNQTVQMHLADMWTEIEVARTIVWKAAWSAEHNPRHDIKLGLAAELYPAEACVRICSTAIQLWGKHGFRRENPIEKLWRDSFVASHGDGLNDLNRLRIARALFGKGAGGYFG